MKYILFLFLLSSVNSFGQENKGGNSKREDGVIAVSVVMPEFPGGVIKMNEFIAANYVYPKVETNPKIRGTIWVSCYIEIDGLVTTIKIEKGLSILLDKEAIKVIRLMPKWKPGEDLNGNVKRMKYYIPIKI
mgnify:CR=1 FL=1